MMILGAKDHQDAFRNEFAGGFGNKVKAKLASNDLKLKVR